MCRHEDGGRIPCSRGHRQESWDSETCPFPSQLQDESSSPTSTATTTATTTAWAAASGSQVWSDQNVSPRELSPNGGCPSIEKLC